MANECGIGQFQDVHVEEEEEEDEVELSLGLSIGRSFRKLEKLKPIKPKRVCSSSMNDAKSGEIDMKLGENNGSFCRSSFSPILNAGFSSREANESNGVAEIMDSKRKREIHALRRQEARKKREEKRQKKGIYSAKNNGIYVNGSNLPMRTGSIDDKIMLEAQVFQFRVKDREVKENQASRSEGISKKEKPENQGSRDEKQDTNPSLEDNETLNQKPNKSNPSTMSSLPLPVAPVQYIPFANGFSFPCVMPCLVPLSAASGDDKNVFHPIAQRSFKPFFQVQNPNVNRNCSDLEQNGNSDGGIKPKESSLASCGSSGNSSANSDHQSTYLQGGSSRETTSHSSNSEEESKQSPSYHHGSSHQGVDEAINNGDNLVSSNTHHSRPKKSEESITVTESIPINKPISNSENSSSQPIFPPVMEAKGDKNKPPRPQTNHSQTMPLPRIPCVSTTGNGPNGKTINGFLYRYTKTEVSIICVCHGSSFSPAEFVEHAGGTDILNPLKHIVVVPSALG